MKTYHVEITTPAGVEIIADAIPARSGQAAIEKVIRAAGYTGFRVCWHQGYGVDYPAGKRPACPVFTDGKNNFIHSIAWTE